MSSLGPPCSRWMGSMRCIQHPRSIRVQARCRTGAVLANPGLSSRWTNRQFSSAIGAVDDGVDSLLPLHNDSTSQTLDPSRDKALGEWESIIGLEMHVQIKSPRKLFSSSSTQFAQDPNTQVVPFDAAFPGTLPVLDRKAVEVAVRTALSLGCVVVS